MNISTTKINSTGT